MVTNADYKVMLKSLRIELKGHYTEIARRMKMDPSSILKVLRGEWINDDVINCAIEYRDELRTKNALRIQKLSKAIGA